jgi:hypothetical protein
MFDVLDCVLCRHLHRSEVFVLGLSRQRLDHSAFELSHDLSLLVRPQPLHSAFGQLQ